MYVYIPTNTNVYTHILTKCYDYISQNSAPQSLRIVNKCSNRTK